MAKSALKSVSIIIPVYNEEKTVAKIIAAVKKADSLRLKKEILVVNDASTDKTAKILKTIRGIKVLSHKQNRGKGAAIKTGLMTAKGEIILIQDADLEYSPSEFPRLLQPFFEYEADVVYGSRFRGGAARRVIYFTHEIANHFLTFYSNLLTNINLTDMECGYKVFRRQIVSEFADKLVSERFGIEPEITARIAKDRRLKFYEVSITYHGRTYAEGKKIGFADFVKALYEITVFNLFTQ